MGVHGTIIVERQTWKSRSALASPLVNVVRFSSGLVLDASLGTGIGENILKDITVVLCPTFQELLGLFLQLIHVSNVS